MILKYDMWVDYEYNTILCIYNYPQMDTFITMIFEDVDIMTDVKSYIKNFLKLGTNIVVKDRTCDWLSIMMKECYHG